MSETVNGGKSGAFTSRGTGSEKNLACQGVNCWMLIHFLSLESVSQVFLLGKGKGYPRKIECKESQRFFLSGKIFHQDFIRSSNRFDPAH